MKGSYTLLIHLEDDTSIEVGSLGTKDFEEGYYAYNGSAFGPGGLKRVQRHKELAENGGNTHWHIDYILHNEKTDIVKAFKAEGKDLECKVSTNHSKKVSDFGSSDCNCKSHLLYFEDRDSAEEYLEQYYS